VLGAPEIDVQSHDEPSDPGVTCDAAFSLEADHLSAERIDVRFQAG
jgi:hypothetical protein